MGFWSKLGKIASFAAPIVAAPFTGGASLAAIGAGAGAANAALNKQGVKGMLMGAGLGAIPGLAGAGKAAGAAANGIASGVPAGLPGAVKGFGGGVMSKLLNGDTLLAAGKGLASVGQTAAHNRGVKLDAMMAGDEMKMAHARNRAEEERDIMRKMQQAEYLKGGGFKDMSDRGIAGNPAGKTIDFGLRGATDAEKQASTELEKQLMTRLNNPMQLQDYSKQMDPGFMERLAGYAGPAISTLGVARGGGRYDGPKAPVQPQQPETMVQLPTFKPKAVNAARDPWGQLFTGE